MVAVILLYNLLLTKGVSYAKMGIPESSTSVLYEFLNKLGKEGWEMINFAFFPNRTAFYYFKRPVE